MSVHFTPDDRADALRRLLDALQTDERLAGVVIVGSGAVGFEDAYSDIDLAVVVTREADVEPVFRDWQWRVWSVLPVRHAFESLRGPNIFLFGLLLDNYLEIDASFQSLCDLMARRGRWQVAFDRSGDIEGILCASWDAQPTPDVAAEYRRWLLSIWYYVTHVAIHARRGHWWRAVLDLEDLRQRAVVLAGLRHGVETQHFRDVHRLPADFQAALAQTLVARLEADEIRRALHAAVDCFFGEACALDAQLGLDLAAPLEATLRAYLAEWD